MPKIARRYTDEQRDALELAYCDRRLRPVRRIPELAQAGGLTGADGNPLPAFTVPESTVRAFGERAERRRKAGARRALAELPPRDALELVRRRLLGAIDRELARVEREQDKPKAPEISGERLRQLGRAARELAALPGPAGEPPAAPAPGSAAAGDGPTRGGLAGQLLAATGRRPIAAQDDAPDLHHEHGETTPPANTDNERINAATTDAPGAFASARIAALGAEIVRVERT